MFAIRGADGRIERLAGSFAAAQLQRVSWYERDRFVYLSLGVCLLVGVCVLYNLGLRLARRYVFHSSQPIAPPDRVALSVLPIAASVYWLLLLISLAMLFSRFDEDSLPPSSSWDKVFLVGDGLFVIALILSVFAVLAAARIWRRPATSRISQIKYYAGRARMRVFFVVRRPLACDHARPPILNGRSWTSAPAA